MKTKLIVLSILSIFLLTQCNQGKTPAPVTAITEPEKAQPIDTTGSKPYPVMLTVVKSVDSIAGFAVAKAVVNEKTLQAELKVYKYLDANMKPLENGTRIVDVRKRE